MSIFFSACLWAIGVGLFAGLTALVVTFLRDGEVWLALLIAIVGYAFLGLLGVLAWDEMESEKSPILATLRKGEWFCSRSITQTTLVPLLIGKVTILQPMTQTVCTAFEKGRRP